MKGTTLGKIHIFILGAFSSLQAQGQIELEKKIRVLIVRGFSLRQPECLEIEWDTTYMEEPQIAPKSVYKLLFNSQLPLACVSFTLGAQVEHRS